MRHSRRDGKRERGQILVLFELVLIVILGFAAMVIDLGVLRNNRQILVNTLDAAALTGGSVLPVDGTLLDTDPHSWKSAKALIDANIQANYPGLPTSAYTITYRCLIGADSVTAAPLISRDIPGVCDPHNALHHVPLGTPPVYAVASDFTGIGKTRVSACDPEVGDKCNVVMITGSATTQYALAPVLGVSSGSTGSVVSAACKGACWAPPDVPVDLVIILDRTWSMNGNDSSGHNKIASLKSAANAVLGVYNPTKQRVALGLTGPSAVDLSTGDPSQTCSTTGFGQAQDNNFFPNTTLTSITTTLINPTTAITGRTTLSAAISTSTTTIPVTSKAEFPTTFPFSIKIDSETMTVTANSGAGAWIATRGSSHAAHASGAAVSLVNAINASTTTIPVPSKVGFPTTFPFTIVVDSEQMTVTADASTAAWTVSSRTGGVAHNGGAPVSLRVSTTDTKIYVSSAAGFPTSGSYTVMIDTEHMVVTAGFGTTTWTVTRHADSTTANTHNGGATVSSVVGLIDTKIYVAAAPTGWFPTSGSFTIKVGPAGTASDEQMLVTGGSATTTWTVTRHVNSTSAAVHNTGDTVQNLTGWVPGPLTAGAWVPVGRSGAEVGLSGTDTDSPPAYNPSPNRGDYSNTSSDLVQSIACISAASYGTTLATPINMAHWYLNTYGREGSVKGILLETDGQPQDSTGALGLNNAQFTCTAADAAATAAKLDGIKIYAVGYGVSQNCQTHSQNTQESTYWSGKTGLSLLQSMASGTAAPYFFDSPAGPDLAAYFQAIAVDLAHGGAHLIELYPPPVVTHVGSGTGSVTISGEYLTGVYSVKFGVASATFTPGTDSSFTATVPPGTPGSKVDVIVTTPGGVSKINKPGDEYTYPP
ncbi:MAG: Tad domain-containing protein [Candidatus Limnocylindrales bacterium]